MGVSDVMGGFQARRVLLPSSGVDSWTVIGPDLRPVEEVEEYLGWLTSVERSPNTVEAYARDLRLFWTFLAEIDTQWDAVDVAMLGEFAAWARRPAANVVVLHEQAARRSAKTVNRMLTSVVGFYEFPRPPRQPTGGGVGRHDPRRVWQLQAVSGRDRAAEAARAHGPVAGGQAASADAVAGAGRAVIDCQQRLRDRFLFALLASTGMRIGQALAMRHEDIVSWERRVVIEPRDHAPARARSKNRGRASIPVPGELIRLWSDYMHEEYGDLDADHVFINLWEGKIGRPLSYASVDKLVARTRRRVGFHFTPHMFRHTYATLAYRDGVALEVIGAVLTHRSPSSTLVYAHPTAEDLRKALDERGVLDRVRDLIT